MNELALFAGAGGGILAGRLLGWRCICAVERDAYAAGILARRQNDGCLEAFPVWSDVTTFDGRPWRGRVDVIFGLWKHFARIIRQVVPWWAVEPDVGRVAHGVAHRVDRVRALGNGQVPAVAALAWALLAED